MNKRTMAKIYGTLGAPFELAMWGFCSAIGNTDPTNLLWSIPLGLITLPLAPFTAEASKLNEQIDREDFEIKTSHLPHMSNVPDDHQYIHPPDERHQDQTWCTSNGDYCDFASEEELRERLIADGYREVINESNQQHHLWGTCWVK